MRLEKVSATLSLARELASDPEGLTIDDISARFAVSRRTAERMRDAVEATFGPLDRIEDGRRIRFRIAAGGLGRFATAPTAAEMAELINLARATRARDPARAELLESLAAKIVTALRAPDRRRLAPDIEAHLSTEVWAHTPGPKIACKPGVLKVLREALLKSRAVRIEYRRVGEDDVRCYRLTPLGLIFGPRHYLVAAFSNTTKPHILRLDRLTSAVTTDDAGDRPEFFDIRAYAERSFAVFQEDPHDIEIVFPRASAIEAQRHSFHPGQTTEANTDGSLTVAFSAGGVRQLQRYLRGFRPVAPPEIRTKPSKDG